MSARPAPTLALALLALAAAGPALGQGDHHAAGEAFVAIAHDAPPDGRAVVGNVAHFAAVLFGEDGRPLFHRNVEVAVELNGVTLFRTTPESGHDYDGVVGVDVVFPVPGVYRVTATTEGPDGEMTGEFTGRVVAAEAPIEAALAIEAPSEAAALEPVPFTITVQDAAGALLPHTDAVVEARRLADRALVFRAHTHTHEAPMAIDLAFPEAGEYDVTVLAYTAFPSEGAPHFDAFTATHRVAVAPAAPLPPGPPAMPSPNAERNDVTDGDAAGDYALLGTYDPYTLVGPYGQARLSALVVDRATGGLVQHVNFAATLRDPFGRAVFASESLHEYDGILEVLAGGQAPGEYVLQVEASRGDWTGTLVQRYTVAPPVAPLSVGPQLTEAEGLDALAAGAPAEVALSVHDLAGRPFAHGEVDLAVLPDVEGAAPVLATKLHTHGDGRFPFTLALPAAGDYVLRATPFSLEPRPTPAFFGPSLGEPAEFRFAVAEGPGFPAAAAEPLAPTSAPAPPARVPAPGAEALALLAGAALLAAAGRRRA